MGTVRASVMFSGYGVKKWAPPTVSDLSRFIILPAAVAGHLLRAVLHLRPAYNRPRPWSRLNSVPDGAEGSIAVFRRTWLETPDVMAP